MTCRPYAARPALRGSLPYSLGRLFTSPAQGRTGRGSPAPDDQPPSFYFRGSAAAPRLKTL